MNTARCPKCNYEAPTIVYEECLVGVDDHVVSWTKREFQADCPIHGPFVICRIPGHHSTHSETNMEAAFPKPIRKALKSALPAEEGKSFEQALRGKRIPKDKEVMRWLSIARGK